MRAKKAIILSVLVIGLSLVTSLNAKNITEITGGSAATGKEAAATGKEAAATGKEAATQSLFTKKVTKEYTQDDKFDTATIEKAIKSAATTTLDTLNDVQDMLDKKANPLDGKVEAAFKGTEEVQLDKDGNPIVSGMTQIRANVGEMAKLLNLDYVQFGEKDPKALGQITDLETKITDLTTNLENLEVEISLGTVEIGSINVPVIGTSRIQVFDITVNGIKEGTTRVRCGAYKQNQQLINFNALNYCVATVWSNSSTRINDAHPKETTDTYFIGFSEPYIPGTAAQVTIKWDPVPYVNVIGELKHYNIKDQVSLDAMSFENTLTAEDGTKYAGKDAMIAK